MLHIDASYILIHAALIALFVVFITHLWYKWKLHVLYDTYRRPWMPKRCLLCWSWWLGVVICGVSYVLGADANIWACIVIIPPIVLYSFK